MHIMLLLLHILIISYTTNHFIYWFTSKINCSKSFVYIDLQTELTTLNLKIVIFKVKQLYKEKK